MEVYTKWKFVKEDPALFNILILPEGTKIIFPNGPEVRATQKMYLQVLRMEPIIEEH